jgi:peptide/nickel transport system permease protein
VRFRFGTSLLYNEPVTTVIAAHLPPTLVLTGSSLFIALLVGVPSGIIAAAYPKQIATRGIDVAWLLLLAMPNFWLALLLVQVSAVGFQWFPVVGYGTLAALVMPSLGIGARLIALISQVTRSSVLETLRQPYIQVAEAKGVSKQSRLLKHALKPAALPIVTMVGLQTGYLLGGSVVIENVFSISASRPAPSLLPLLWPCRWGSLPGTIRESLTTSFQE